MTKRMIEMQMVEMRPGFPGTQRALGDVGGHVGAPHVQ